MIIFGNKFLNLTLTKLYELYELIPLEQLSLFSFFILALISLSLSEICERNVEVWFVFSPSTSCISTVHKINRGCDCQNPQHVPTSLCMKHQTVCMQQIKKKQKEKQKLFSFAHILESVISRDQKDKHWSFCNVIKSPFVQCSNWVNKEEKKSC